MERVTRFSATFDTRRGLDIQGLGYSRRPSLETRLCCANEGCEIPSPPLLPALDTASRSSPAVATQGPAVQILPYLNRGSHHHEAARHPINTSLIFIKREVKIQAASRGGLHRNNGPVCGKKHSLHGQDAIVGRRLVKGSPVVDNIPGIIIG